MYLLHVFMEQRFHNSRRAEIFNAGHKLPLPNFKKQNELGAASILTNQMEVVKLFQDKRFRFCDLKPPL